MSSHHHDSHEHMGGGHPEPDHENDFWKACSEKYYGDDKHEFEVKRAAFIGIFVAVIAVITIFVIITVCCCKKKKQRAAAARRAAVKQAVVHPIEPIHPKALEAFGPTGVPEPMVVTVTNAPPYEEKDPRLTLGVMSPPPVYEEMK
eukprot:TRINITY_DN26108_c0_g1_i1.p1 TRINITY_DN26108_c0_g1~~TRINITY_DN26108_c0_g1_i1.p1  ORF type:complete len:146 (+),score=20.98 TRINITY_DN26108_c0_g1_i1:139-576(+)